MFEKFSREFLPVSSGGLPVPPWSDRRLKSVAGYRAFTDRFSGCSFQDGLFWTQCSKLCR